jgi:hypothetical protein
MKEATRRQIGTGTTPGEEDLSCGYGWQLWMCRTPGMYRFDGGQGQFCIMDTERDLAVAIHEGGVHPYGVQKVLDLTEAMMTRAQPDALPEDTDAFNELKTYLENRALKPSLSKPIPKTAKGFEGTYSVTEGVFNPWIEVAPVDVDFYHLFYDPYIRPEISVFDIALTADEAVLTLNRQTVLRARLDGIWKRGDAQTVMPPLGAYAATARFEDAGTLGISLRWLNGWCCPELKFKMTGESDLSILCKKDMLHQGREPFTREAKARKIK